jgi:histone deacetylase 4/5
MASLEEIRSVHSEQHTLTYGTDMLSNVGTTSGAKLGGKLSVLGCGGLGVDADTYWNDRFTGVAARTAVGSVVELATKVSEP